MKRASSFLFAAIDFFQIVMYNIGGRVENRGRKNMILYHGSNLIVDKPRILTPNRYLDFGTGFYTTSNLSQAKSFADKVTARKGEGISTVSKYEFDESASGKLKVLAFEAAGEAWLDFVSDNRSGNPQGEEYDLIYGPVADDDIFRTFLLYSAGLLSKEQTLEALRIKKLFNQYVFKNEKALQSLKFIGTEEVI